MLFTFFDFFDYDKITDMINSYNFKILMLCSAYKTALAITINANLLKFYNGYYMNLTWICDRIII